MRILKDFLSKQFIWFLIFGGSAALVSVATGWLIYSREANVIPYPLAVSIGAVAGIAVNFSLNYAFNFNFRERGIWEQFWTFFLVAGFGVFLTAGLAKLLLLALQALGGNRLYMAGRVFSYEFIAHFISVGLTTIYSFLAHKYISFNVGFMGLIRGLGKKKRAGAARLKLPALCRRKRK